MHGYAENTLWAACLAKTGSFLGGQVRKCSRIGREKKETWEMGAQQKGGPENRPALAVFRKNYWGFWEFWGSCDCEGLV